MKKIILFVAIFGASSFSFAKENNNGNDNAPIIKDLVISNKDFTKLTLNEKGNVNEEKLNMVNFPITFCDSYGCETYEVDTSIYSWQDVMDAIDYWLTWKH